MKHDILSFSENFPEKGIDAAQAYRKICEELTMDGNIHLDLGSFTTTLMDPYADKLIMDQIGKNFIDFSEYQQTKKIHDRVVTMLSAMLHAPAQLTPVGTATIGSSEAVELALLAHKWHWKKRQQANNRSTARPNIVYSSNAHVCWDKFALYFDVEPRKIPIKSFNDYPIEEILKNVDKNTICVGTVAGNTYTGSIDPIQELNHRLSILNQENGWDIGIHVDAAIGGFILPFLPETKMLKWDFRLHLVRTINLSGHKFGLVYPGVGWLIFRDQTALPRELIFSSHYLVEPIETYTLNFSKGSSMILAQYFTLLQHGIEGYEKIISQCCTTANILRQELEQSGYFKIIDDRTLPVVAFQLKNSDVVDIQALVTQLRAKNWMLPAYKMPQNLENKILIRVVVKENFSPRMAEILSNDIITAYEKLSFNT